MNDATRIEEELFDQALRLGDPDKVRALLDRRCREAPSLRLRIEALLAAHAESEAFFAESESVVRISDTFARMKLQVRPPAGTLPAAGETAGVRIDRYKLLEKIGEGGCGAVYLAEQEEPVRRIVALKIIRVGMETRSVIARFEAERQALAMMDHPNIARVFDAGATATGSPYFVMEHVQGVRITDYCDTHQLTLRQRLDLFIQVCHAIQHAHQKGIIHGDIKPSNIMIAQHDGVPQPKVIDFGIARATEARLGERFIWSTSALWIGTPAYMSPEQIDVAGTDVDTRSDIYSLGVLLFELLTGRTAMGGELSPEADLEQIQRVMREHQPQRPSAVLSQMHAGELARVAAARSLAPGALIAALRGDLDCIAMKALERDRRKRYETANGLAMDAQRHLQHEPVLAHAPGWFYSFRKTVRRNRAMFVASSVVLVTLLAALGVSSRLFLKEREARQRAVAAERQQARLRHQAEVREKTMQGALMVRQGNYAEADEILDHVALSGATVEGAAVFRAVGEWHALNCRWADAARRFSTLLRIDELDATDVRTLDMLEMGPVLVNMGDQAAYDHFRREALAQAPSAGGFADRIMKVCLLTPADPQMLADIRHLATQATAEFEAAEAAGKPFEAGWRSMSLALFEVRAGDYEGAIAHCHQSLSFLDSNPPRIATVRIILSMALAHAGRMDEARHELAEAESFVSTHDPGPSDRGTPVQGFWFDWAFARVLLREAQALIAAPPVGA